MPVILCPKPEYSDFDTLKTRHISSGKTEKLANKFGDLDEFRMISTNLVEVPVNRINAVTPARTIR